MDPQSEAIRFVDAFVYVYLCEEKLVFFVGNPLLKTSKAKLPIRRNSVIAKSGGYSPPWKFEFEIDLPSISGVSTAQGQTLSVYLCPLL